AQTPARDNSSIGSAAEHHGNSARIGESMRLGGEPVRHELQLLEVLLHELQILRSVPVEIDPAEVVSDEDPVLISVLASGLGEDLVDEFADAADALATDHPEDVAFGEFADPQAIGFLARIEEQRPAFGEEVIG